MKKLILIALLAMMLLGMLTFVACKAKTEEPATTDEVQEPAPTTETVPADTTTVVPVTPPAGN